MFLLYTKMTNGYYQKDKEKLQNEAERYQNLFKEEKEKKHQYGFEQCNNLLQDECEIFFLECKK